MTTKDIAGKWITVDDRMQSGYRYALSAREGQEFHPDDLRGWFQWY